MILTLTSSTAPGGYAAPVEASPQFPVFKQDLAAAVGALESDGFEVRFDWDTTDLEACQRTAG